jgi:hypothetical protein
MKQVIEKFKRANLWVKAIITIPIIFYIVFVVMMSLGFQEAFEAPLGFTIVFGLWTAVIYGVVLAVSLTLLIFIIKFTGRIFKSGSGLNKILLGLAFLIIIGAVIYLTLGKPFLVKSQCQRLAEEQTDKIEAKDLDEFWKNFGLEAYKESVKNSTYNNCMEEKGIKLRY